jgi:hypothetical protein
MMVVTTAGVFQLMPLPPSAQGITVTALSGSIPGVFISSGLLGLMVALEKVDNASVALESPVSIQSLPRRRRCLSSPASHREHRGEFPTLPSLFPLPS